MIYDDENCANTEAVQVDERETWMHEYVQADRRLAEMSRRADQIRADMDKTQEAMKRLREKLRDALGFNTGAQAKAEMMEAMRR